MLKKILTLLHPGEVILLLLLSLLALLSNIGLLGTAAWLISSAALLPPLYSLTLGITTVRALGIGRALLRYGERYFTHKSAFSILGILRLRLYDLIKVQASLPHGQKNKGILLDQLLSQAEILQDFLLRGLLPPLVLMLSILLISLLLVPFSPCAAFILPVLYLIHCLPLWLAPTATNCHSPYQDQLLDFAQGCHEIQLAGSLQIATKKLDHSAQQWQNNLLKDNHHTDRIDLFLSLLRNITFVLLFSLLIKAVNQGQLSGITMSLLLLVLLGLLNELSFLPPALRHFRQAQKSTGWLNESTLECPPPQKLDSHYLISVSQLNFHYPQGLPIFSPLTFSISPGYHTAIIGDSGSGKTTLAYLLSGLWQPTEGTIHYGNSYTPFVCTIPQGSFLFSTSIRENFLRLHPGITDAAIHHSLHLAQLATVIKKLPQGIDTPLGENACSLSGGERNRLTSALILASPSPILLFDEPTAGLEDPLANQLLTAIIEQANRTEQTVILITHDLLQLHRFSQIIQLSPQDITAN